MAAGLRKAAPYWYQFRTYAKQRWFGRHLVEVLTTEFRDRTKAYYIWAIHKGICTINGQKADPLHIIQDGDVICNNVHRHEPPVTDDSIRFIHRDDQQGILVIVKPGSIPVHAAGRYLKHTLQGLLETEYGIERVYTTNRLDRLTSGIMVCSTKKEMASKLGSQFHAGLVNKAYVCRVRGKFPDGEVVCKQPILTIDRQSGVNIVHPKGKPSETIFVRLSYDTETDSSVVFCRPITGRTHQIRVHVQYLGHPICNDPIYGHQVWNQVDTSKFAHVVPDQWKQVGGEIGIKEVEDVVHAIKCDQDDQEDWSRWKDEVLFRDLNMTEGFEDIHVPGPNGKSSRPPNELLQRALKKLESQDAEIASRGLNRPLDIETAWQRRVREQSSDFCPQCKIPLLPDPKPEELYIYLHAIKYWTHDWKYEDALPWWAREDWRSIPQRGLGADTDADPCNPNSTANISTLPQDLAVANLFVNTLSSNSAPIESLVTAEIEEKAARLVDPTKMDDAAKGVMIESAKQLVDLPVIPFQNLQKDSPLHQRIQAASKADNVQAPVVFEVFRGFEDFAQREVLQQIVSLSDKIETSDSVPITSSHIHSAHVQVTLPVFSSLALRSYLGAGMPIAKHAYLMIGMAEFPSQMYLDLKKERLKAGSSNRRSKKKEGERKDKESKKATANTKRFENKFIDHPETAAEVELVDSKDDKQEEISEDDQESNDIGAHQGFEPKLSPTEKVFLERVQKMWDEHADQRQEALESWFKIKQACLGRAITEQEWSFRATVERSTYTLPSLNSISLERYIGTLGWAWLNGDSTTPKWRVDLEKPLIEITFKLVPGFGIADEFERDLSQVEIKDDSLKTEGRIMFMIKLPDPLKEYTHRPVERNEILVGGTTMAPYRASMLAASLPLPTLLRNAETGVETDQIDKLRILEPCCGHGSLVFETANALESRGFKAEVLGCDIDRATVERAQTLLTLNEVNNDETKSKTKIKLACVDVTQKEDLLSFVGGKNSIDAIITDLPWGRREKSKSTQSLSDLYSKFLESWLTVLRIGGYIVTVTAEHKTLRRALVQFENECRKKRVGCILKVKELGILPAEEKDTLTRNNDSLWKVVSKMEDTKVVQQASADAKRTQMVRKIEIGYHVYVFLIQKVAIL